jgi:hypothetical protein
MTQSTETAALKSVLICVSQVLMLCSDPNTIEKKIKVNKLTCFLREDRKERLFSKIYA